MTRRRLAACLQAAGLLTSCAWTSCASLPREHVGPVTGLAEGGSISCSQVGVRTPTGWIRPGFRAMSVAARDGWILVGGGVPAERGDVALFGRNGDEISRVKLSDDLVYSVAMHPTKPLAVAGCADGSVLLMQLPDLRVSRRLTPHTAPCRVVAFSTDGEHAASGGLDGLVHLHLLPAMPSIPLGPPGRTVVLKEHTAGVECLLFVGDRLYSGARDGKVRLHERGRLVRTYLRLGGRVHALATSEGRVLAGLDDGRIWQLAGATAQREAVGATDPIFAMVGIQYDSNWYDDRVKALQKKWGVENADVCVGTSGGLRYLPIPVPDAAKR